MPGSEKHALFIEMLRITFPYVLFISLASLAGSILNSYQRFAIPALSPVLHNLAMIAAALGLAPLMVRRLGRRRWPGACSRPASCNCCSSCLRWPSWACCRDPGWDFAHAGVRKILKLMVPTLFGSSVVQFNLLVNTMAASFLIGGSMTWLYYSDRLLEFPLGMFGVAIGTVILPHLSSRHAATDPDGFSKGLDWGFRLCLLIGLPACAGLILCAEPLMATLFQYRNFSAMDAKMSSLSLIAQSTAVPAFLLVKVLAPAFYARQDTRTPVKAAIVAVLTNAICTVGLFAWLLHATPTGQAALQAGGGSWRQALAGIPGAHALLALAIAIAGWVNALQLAWLLRRAGVYRRQPGWGRFLWRLAAATLALVLVVLAFRLAWMDWGGWAWWERGWRLAAMVGAGGVAYAGVLLALGMRPRDLRH